MKSEFFLGDCKEVLKTFPANHFDSIVCDPPYSFSFMGLEFDTFDSPQHFQNWIKDIFVEAYRVLKPGGYVLAFGGARTYHRMASGIEDAGFEIRDQIMWIYGSGFPKGVNISKAIDKRLGKERKKTKTPMNSSGNHEQAKKWNGRQTALKPAHEPIVLAMKPIDKTYADNILNWGTGGLNIDECRVPTNDSLGKGRPEEMLGRYPANVIHDGSEEVVSLFPNSKGHSGDIKESERSHENTVCYGEFNRVPFKKRTENNQSASRFFYCAKTSKKDRDEGLEKFEEKKWVQFQTSNGTSGKPSSISEGRNTSYKNVHPTVKPTDLMRYLIRLVTPKNGTVLDPFMGSGSTGKAAFYEGMKFVGIEINEEYYNIAKKRVENLYMSSIENAFDE